MKDAKIASITLPSAEREITNRALNAANPVPTGRFLSNRKAMALFEAYEKTKDPRIRDQIFSEYAGLASICAWKYSGRGVDFEDLRQEGCMGLLRAIDGFDPGRGVQFHTYATYFVEGYIRQYFRDKAWICHVPRSVKAMSLRIKELSDELGRMPTKQEAASACGIPADKMDDAFAAANTWNPVSLQHDELNPASDFAFADAASYIDEDLESVPLRLDIRNASQKVLSQTEACVVKLYCEDDLSQRDIACKLGTYQMMVSRLLRRGTGKLGEALGDEEKLAG